MAKSKKKKNKKKKNIPVTTQPTTIAGHENEIDQRSINFQAAACSLKGGRQLIEVVEFLKADQELCNVQWANVKPVTIDEAQNGNYTWKPVKIIGWYNKIGSAAPLKLNTGNRISVHSLKLSDRHGGTIECMKTFDETIADFKGKTGNKNPLIFCGIIAHITLRDGKNKEQYRFFLTCIMDYNTSAQAKIQNSALNISVTGENEFFIVDTSDINAAQTHLNTTKWETIFTRPAQDILNEQLVMQPVKIYAHVFSISEPEPSGTDDNRITIMRLTLQDRDGAKIKCIPVSQDGMITKLKEIYLKHRYCVFSGTVYPKKYEKNKINKLKKDKKRYRNLSK